MTLPEIFNKRVPLKSGGHADCTTTEPQPLPDEPNFWGTDTPTWKRKNAPEDSQNGRDNDSTDSG